MSTGSPRFSVGQRVRVNCPGSEQHGRVTRIVDGPVRGHDCDNLRDRGLFYLVDFPPLSDGVPWGYRPHELIPIDDQFEPGSWSELADIWKPEGVRC